MRICAQCQSTVNWSKNYCPLCSAPMLPGEQKTEQPAVNTAPPLNTFAENNQPSEPQKEQIDQPMELKTQIPIPERQTSDPEFTTGSVLSRTWSTLFRNPTVFFGICFIAQIPNFLLVYYFQSTSSDVKISATVVVIALISGIITMLAQGALSYAVYQTLLGKTASIGESISRCLPQLGTVLIAALFVKIGAGLGYLLFIIPGIILMCKWSVTVQACVVEKLGPKESMDRSADLTEGYRMTIFFLTAITILINQLIEKLAPFVFWLIFPQKEVVILLSNIFLVIPTAFNSVMVAVTYYWLREVKEGVGVDALVNVFD